MRSVGFVLCTVVFALGSHLIYAQNVTACGHQLSANSIYRGVPALSNGSDQWGDLDCLPDIQTPCRLGVDNSTGATSTCSYGDRFQCVEYVRRFYSLRQDTAERVDTSGWVGLNAVNFIKVDANGNFSSPLKGFTAFPNNGTTLPLPDDIIVFKGGGFGHVAIVTSVTSSNVNIIEQNWNIQGLYSLMISPSTNTVENRMGADGTVFTVVGWLRANSAVVSNPVPAISALNPSSALVGSNGQTLTIQGTGFIPTSVAAVSSVSHPTSYVSATELTISLSSTDLETAGSFPVVVVNPVPGGGTSNTAYFTVNNPAPSISSLSPSSLPAGSPAQTLTINGSGFVSDSSVTFNGNTKASTFVNANQLTIQLSSTDLSTAGTFPVTVTNPAPGGGISTATFSVMSGSYGIHEWTWMGGSNTAGEAGVYGALGVPSTNNIPGARDSSVTWINSSGYLWLFGGEAEQGGTPDFNDLWRFNPATGAWTWMSGSDTTGASGDYGTLGVPSPSNVPPARGMGAVGWMDSAGNFWLFGGYGDNGNLNDLWKYSPDSKEWTWMSGSSTAEARGVYGTRGVFSATNVPGAHSSAVSWTDSHGNFWLFGGFGDDANGDVGNLNDLWEFNPSTNQWAWMGGSSSTDQAGIYGTLATPATGNIPGARTGATGWVDSSGKLWLFGGSGYDGTGYFSQLNDLWKFNPSTNQWTWMGGSNTGDHTGVYGTIGIPAADNIPGSRDSATGWTDTSGHFWLFGGGGYDANGEGGYLNDLWEFNPSTNQWTWISGSNTALGANAVYGTQGVPAAANVPGGRQGSVSWIDASGNLWLFGGNCGSCTSVTRTYELNDLWRYQPQPQPADRSVHTKSLGGTSSPH